MGEEEIKQSAELFTLMARATNLTRQHSRAVQLIKFMQEKGLNIDAQMHYNETLESCFRGHKPDKASEILEMMGTDVAHIDSTLYLLIRGFAKTGKIELAFKYYENLKAKNSKILNTFCLNSFLESCIKQEQLQKAVEVFNEHLDASIPSEEEGQTQPVVDLITFSTMVKGFNKFGQLDSAFDIFAKMKLK